MKATMNGDGEIGYTADVGMTEVYEGTGAFKDFKAAKSNLVHTWHAYPMESFMATHASRVGQVAPRRGASVRVHRRCRFLYDRRRLPCLLLAGDRTANRHQGDQPQCG